MRGTPGNLENLWNQKSKNNLNPKKKKVLFFLIRVFLGSQTIQSIYYTELFESMQKLYTDFLVGLDTLIPSDIG